MKSRIFGAVTAITALFILAGCAGASMMFEDFNRKWKGISATITTYDQAGELIDRVHGTSSPSPQGGRVSTFRRF